MEGTQEELPTVPDPLIPSKTRAKLKLLQTRNKVKSEKFMRITRLAFKILSKLKVIPVEWDDRNQIFLPYRPFSLQNVMYTFAFTVLCIDFMFIVLRFIQSVTMNGPIKGNEIAIAQIISAFSHLSTRSLIFNINLNLALHKAELANFINKVLHVRRAARLNKDYPAAKIFIVTFMLRAIQNTLAAFARPNKSHYWYSVLPKELQTNWMFILHLLFNLQTSFMILNILFGAISVMLYTVTLQTLLQSEVTVGYLVFYRKLQILSYLLRETYAGNIYYMKYHSFIVSVILLFGCIRYVGVIDVRVYAQMPLTLALILTFAIKFYSTLGKQPKLSERARRRWFVVSEDVSVEKRRLNLKYRKSSRPISMPTIGPRFLPSLLRFIVFQTTRLLILSSR